MDSLSDLKIARNFIYYAFWFPIYFCPWLSWIILVLKKETLFLKPNIFELWSIMTRGRIFLGSIVEHLLAARVIPTDSLEWPIVVFLCSLALLLCFTYFIFFFIKVSITHDGSTALHHSCLACYEFFGYLVHQSFKLFLCLFFGSTIFMISFVEYFGEKLIVAKKFLWYRLELLLPLGLEVPILEC